jgi:small subunit ribosomal protein S16
MLMIRLQRVGRKNNPSFRVVLTDKQNSTKSGRFLEVLGHHDFRKGAEKDNHVKGDRVKYWISKGAQVSVTAHNVLIDSKVLTGKKQDALPSRKPKAKEEAPKAAAAPVAAEPAPAA